MREILFRGKRLDNGEWVEGFYVALKLLYYDRIEHLITDKDRGTSCEVDPATVGQYIGLKDKNGKRIFEGDVVDILTENEEIGIVTYDDGGFWVEADGFRVDFHHNINGTDLEVIDNIHDDPELLEDIDNG